MSRRFLLVGLTGGIGTGKSTVAEMFRRLGCVVIDADVLAREVVAPGEPAYEAIVAEFGPGVLQRDGTLDRKGLGALVFADSAKRKRLEAITHPRIRERFATRLQALLEQEFAGIVLFDAPVMIESGNYRNMDRLVVVVTDAATQRARTFERDGDREDIERRIASQMPLAEKAKLADYVVDNSGGREATEAQTRRVYRAFASEAEASRRLCGHATPLGVLFAVNMGNRGRNELSVRRTFLELANADKDVAFLGYHWRRSGNFIFHDRSAEVRARVIEVGKKVLGLDCIARTFADLARIDWAVPDHATTVRGSVVCDTPSGMRRVIAVLLSESCPASRQIEAGAIPEGVSICAWASDRDLVCLYERPGEAGDVGQVTRSVVLALASRGASTSLYGTGRAMSIVRDILAGRIKSGPPPRAS